MKITSDMLEAYLKCPTKCWLRASGELDSGNTYAEWVKSQTAAYRTAQTERLCSQTPKEDCIVSPVPEDLKNGKWRLAVNVLAQTPETQPCRSQHAGKQPSTLGTSQDILAPAAANEQLQSNWTAESLLHAVERVPSEGRGKPVQVIPIRFIYRNKLTKDDKLLLAFDATVFYEILGHAVSLGKIIHGDGRATLKVKTSALAGEVRKRLGKIATLLDSATQPDLVLNRHCAECEFQARCRKLAIEKDDLSLLAGMSAKERQKLRSKGIFTVTQLSYTFRPRHRPKRMRDKREKYHQAIKALAIREKKIHIVGSPELKIEGTPVYLDVEGLPDRDFYYLIGLRIRNGESAIQHSLWADNLANEQTIWREFLAILEAVEKPVLIHYGSYETMFLKKMIERYGEPQTESVAARAINSAMNAVSVIFAQIYFPTLSNGLKEIASYLGFIWATPTVSGLLAVRWRWDWEQTQGAKQKEPIIGYNADDCQALELVASTLVGIGSAHADQADTETAPAVVHTELLPCKTMWPRFSSPLSEFEQVNKAARWDYQRERVYVRSSKAIRKALARDYGVCGMAKVNKQVTCPDRPFCPNCGGKGHRHFNFTTIVLHDLFFGRTSLKRWVVEYRFRFHWCGTCRVRFGLPKALWPGTKFGGRPGMKFGTNLVAYVIYQAIELRLSQYTIQRHLARVFGYHFNRTNQVHWFKARAAEFYTETRKMILDRIVRGSLVHIDETKANVRGKAAYVWVFTNLHEVAYLYSETRENDIVESILTDFKGVAVSDFYAGYDSLKCPQQKCLLHLVRDLNADLLTSPYDKELKQIIHAFAQLLQEIVRTVDRFGLKSHYLHKHRREVERFFREMEDLGLQSEQAVRCRQRFEKNREKLFTFLDHDGVPWNNNNAEHAIKAFAAFRDIMEGSSTQKGIEQYLILLSVCQTCKYMGLDFLDFLRSGEKDIYAFAESQRGRRGRTDPDRSTTVKSTAASLSKAIPTGGRT